MIMAILSSILLPLETTAEHPFYELESAPWLAVGQTEGRWTDALDLQDGDRVWKADGSSGVVQSVEVALVQQRMYNLTVAEAHTFFVGEQQWLVHNQCGVKFDMRQVQSKFNDHAKVFGVTGNWNPANGAKFQQALEAHVTGKNTVAIQGIYNRGASKMNVTHYFDQTTGLNVMADQNGNFISGWKLNADQITNLLTTGILGGGK